MVPDYTWQEFLDYIGQDGPRLHWERMSLITLGKELPDFMGKEVLDYMGKEVLDYIGQDGP